MGALQREAQEAREAAVLAWCPSSSSNSLGDQKRIRHKEGPQRPLHMETTKPAAADAAGAKPAPSEPRAPRGKKPAPDINEQVAVLGTFAHLSKKAMKVLPLSAKQLGALIIRDPKTMDRDRHDLQVKIAKEEPVDLLHPMSIHCLPTSTGEAMYSAHDVYEYLTRLYDAVDRSYLAKGKFGPKGEVLAKGKSASTGKAVANGQGSAKGKAPTGGKAQIGGKAIPTASTMRGFQSWLSYGDAASTWPFCIQPDGRPLDMCEALVTDRLTEDACRLTIGEFATTLADAVSKAHTRNERDELAEALHRD